MKAQLINSSYPAPIGVQPSWLLPTYGLISVTTFKWVCGAELCGWGGGIPQIPVLGSCREVLAVLAWPVGWPHCTRVQ